LVLDKPRGLSLAYNQNKKMDWKNTKIAIHDILDVAVKTTKNFLDDYIEKKSNETKCDCDNQKCDCDETAEKKERTN